MNRLIAVLEEYLVYTSAGQRVADLNIAAGIALEELRKIRGFYEIGQEAGSSERPITKTS